MIAQIILKEKVKIKPIEEDDEIHDNAKFLDSDWWRNFFHILMKHSKYSALLYLITTALTYSNYEIFNILFQREEIPAPTNYIDGNYCL